MTSTHETSKVKAAVKRIPPLRAIGGLLLPMLRLLQRFPGSEAYWEKRYRAGGTSGAGSYHRLALFKAEVLNGFVAREGVASVIELGCGDGNQLRLAQYPSYLGLDVSETAIAICRDRFAGDPSKTFEHVDTASGATAELALSLDVIYHLVEDDVFDTYMRRLFAAATRFVVVYASNDESLNSRFCADHVRHRKFTDWVERNAPKWQLIEVLPNRYPYRKADPDKTSPADFYFYRCSREG